MYTLNKIFKKNKNFRWGWILCLANKKPLEMTSFYVGVLGFKSWLGYPFQLPGNVHMMSQVLRSLASTLEDLA